MSFSKSITYLLTRVVNLKVKPDDVCRTVHAPQAHQTPRARRGATHTPHRSETIEIAFDATSRMRTAQTSVRCVAAEAKNAQARSHAQARSPRRSHAQTRSSRRSYAQARSPRRSHAQARSPWRSHAQARSPQRLYAQARSPRMRRASCKSTLFMWMDLRLMAIKLASSRRLTKYASVRSYRTRM